MKLDQAIQDQLAAMVAAEGLELLATEVVGSGPKTVLRLVVDGPEGVDLDRCATVSRQASAILDVEDPIQHHYVLEVSSPGLDRKLYRPLDYERFTGRRVRLRLKPGYREHRMVVGQLMGLEGDAVRVESDTGQELRFRLEDIFEARLEVDWNSIMSEGKTRS
ncbi:MAG: ribosome maturation factor RimP [Thermoanaerobaculales bacterium]|jgi:ribosome maturation factor RimP|nr:ribosome maturation factor RimP [Thermoanaerobaculales bacterium]